MTQPVSQESLLGNVWDFPLLAARQTHARHLERWHRE
jgi:hypothetical protein